MVCRPATPFAAQERSPLVEICASYSDAAADRAATAIVMAGLPSPSTLGQPATCPLANRTRDAALLALWGDSGSQ